MSKFYGMIQGNRGAVTRGGSKNSGIRGSVQSWDGSCQTELWYNDSNELMIRLSISEGSSSYGSEILFNGRFTDFRKLFIK